MKVTCTNAVRSFMQVTFYYIKTDSTCVIILLSIFHSLILMNKKAGVGRLPRGEDP